MSSFQPRFGFKIGAATDIGGGRENQDEFFVWYNEPMNIVVVGVLDGHGREVGKAAAQAAKDALQEFFDQNAQLLSYNTADVLIEAHNCAHAAIKKAFQHLLKCQGFDVLEHEEGFLLKKRIGSEAWMCVHGGTSCTLVAVVGSMVYVANVGDSSSLMCASKPVFQQKDLKHEIDAADSSEKTKKLQLECMSSTLVLSAEHSPESADEFMRLRRFRAQDGNPQIPALQIIYDSCGSDKSRCLPVFDTRASTLEPSGRGNYYKNVRKEWASLVATPSSAHFQDALAFTRSLGDLHLHTYGVTHLPEIHSLDLDEIFAKLNDDSRLCIVTATDGVWDNWQFDDVGRFVLDQSCNKAIDEDPIGAQGVTDAFMQRNAFFSRKNFGSQADNATAILMYINKSS